jgi:hypothetical protein
MAWPHAGGLQKPNSVSLKPQQADENEKGRFYPSSPKVVAASPLR